MSLKQTYSKLINKDDLCFDIGANVGIYSNVMLQLCEKVVAVEANHTNIEKLQRLPGLIIEEKAVSDIDGYTSLYINDLNLPLATLTRDWTGMDREGNIHWKESIVECVTINTLIEKYGIPKFCKIDVEGHESKLLSVLKYKIPIISIEFSKLDRDNFLASIGYLKAFGDFEYNFIIDSDNNFALPEFVSNEDIEKTIYSCGGEWGDAIIRYK
jgi:FkbM family methyltransferase